MGEPSQNEAGLPDGHTWMGFWIEPLDCLFFRDGRPFQAATRAEGGLPQPRTLAGAIRTALLGARAFDFRKFAQRLRTGSGVRIKDVLRELSVPEHLVEARFRGPWLARWDRIDAQAHPLLATPANLYRVAGSEQVSRSVRTAGGWVTTCRCSPRAPGRRSRSRRKPTLTHHDRGWIPPLQCRRRAAARAAAPPPAGGRSCGGSS